MSTCLPINSPYLNIIMRMDNARMENARMRECRMRECRMRKRKRKRKGERQGERRSGGQDEFGCVKEKEKGQLECECDDQVEGRVAQARDTRAAPENATRFCALESLERSATSISLDQRLDQGLDQGLLTISCSHCLILVSHYQLCILSR